ncbi:MAG: NUDIX hydrolase [Agarilytica sp.]
MTDELPHITVATVIEHEGKFLMVEEGSAEQPIFNQPAGHLENGETLVEGAIRETLEETCWHVHVIGFLGVSQYIAKKTGVTYVRHTFVANRISVDTKAKRDPDINDAVWMSYEEILEQGAYLRSPLVLNDIQRYRRGKVSPIENIQGFL